MTRLIREHTSQGPKNGPPRYGAIANAVNGWQTSTGKFSKFISAVHGLCKVNQFLKQQQSASSAPATKRRKWNTTVVFFKQDTWTHKFFCLADKEQMAVPSRSFKIQLQQAGAGCKKICFNSKAHAMEVKTKLEESYSTLIADGGFEILQWGLSPSELSIIPPPIQVHCTLLMQLCRIGTSNHLHKICTMQSEPRSHWGSFRGLPGVYNFYRLRLYTTCANIVVIWISENLISAWLLCVWYVIWMKKVTAKAKIKQMVKGTAYATDIWGSGRVSQDLIQLQVLCKHPKCIHNVIVHGSSK